MEIGKESGNFAITGMFYANYFLTIFKRCNTDISFGKNCQVQTLLVLTGVTNMKQLEQFKKDEKHELIPDFYTDCLGDMLDLLEQ